MGAAENKQLFQRVFAELADGDSRPFAAILAEDVRWTVIGTTRHSRTYEGRKSYNNTYCWVHRVVDRQGRGSDGVSRHGARHLRVRRG